MTRCEWLGAGGEARHVLAPVLLEDFASEYFGKRPLYVKGHATKFAGLFDRDAFQRAVLRKSATGEEPSLVIDFNKGDGIATQRVIAIRPQDIGPSLTAGATICFSKIHLFDANLGALADAVRTQIGYPGPVGVHAYMSADGAGFATHFDARIATTLQIEGSKTWRFSKRPALSWPVANATYLAGGGARFINTDVSDGARPDVDEPEVERHALDDFEEVLLEPGDVLALPAGTWHACRAGGFSLALNLHFDVSNFSEVVTRFIREHFVEDRSWRGVPPLLPSSYSVRDQSKQRAAYADYARRRFRELRSWIDTVDPEDPELIDAWAFEVLRLGREPPTVETRPARVEPSTAFAVRHRHLTYCVPFSEGGLALFVGHQKVDVPFGLKSFVERVLHAKTFIAGDVVGWSLDGPERTWSDVQGALAQLEVVGVLERTTV